MRMEADCITSDEIFHLCPGAFNELVEIGYFAGTDAIGLPSHIKFVFEWDPSRLTTRFSFPIQLEREEGTLATLYPNLCKTLENLFGANRRAYIIFGDLHYDKSSCSATE